jgi:hypothetical protein
MLGNFQLMGTQLSLPRLQAPYTEDNIKIDLADVERGFVERIVLALDRNR